MDASRKAGHAVSERDEVLLLQRQIFLWKALLTGEKDAVDSLSAGEYLDVVVESLRRLKRQAKRVLMAAAGPLPLLILAGGTVVVAVAMSKSYTGTASTTVVSTLLAVVATSWRATRVNLFEALATYQAKIRGAAIDSAIAHAITVLPADARMRRIRRRAPRRALVPAASGSVASRTSRPPT